MIKIIENIPLLPNSHKKGSEKVILRVTEVEEALPK